MTVCFNLHMGQASARFSGRPNAVRRWNEEASSPIVGQTLAYTPLRGGPKVRNSLSFWRACAELQPRRMAERLSRSWN